MNVSISYGYKAPEKVDPYRLDFYRFPRTVEQAFGDRARITVEENNAWIKDGFTRGMLVSLASFAIGVLLVAYFQ